MGRKEHFPAHTRLSADAAGLCVTQTAQIWSNCGASHPLAALWPPLARCVARAAYPRRQGWLSRLTLRPPPPFFSPQPTLPSSDVAVACLPSAQRSPRWKWPAIAPHARVVSSKYCNFKNQLTTRSLKNEENGTCVGLTATSLAGGNSRSIDRLHFILTLPSFRTSYCLPNFREVSKFLRPSAPTCAAHSKLVLTSRLQLERAAHVLRCSHHTPRVA